MHDLQGKYSDPPDEPKNGICSVIWLSCVQKSGLVLSKSLTSTKDYYIHQSMPLSPTPTMSIGIRCIHSCFICIPHLS